MKKILSAPISIEIASFTGDSGLADYSVSLARAMAAVTTTPTAKNAMVGDAAVKVTVVTATSLPQRFDSMGFNVERVFRRSRHYPLDIFRFIFGVLARRPHWVVFQGPLKFTLIDGLIVWWLRLWGIRCAITVHDVLPHYPKFWSKFTFGFYYRAFNCAIAHSLAAKDGLGRLGLHNNILVVPHGIYDIFDLNHLSQSSARQLLGHENDNAIWVLFFGHLEPRKGVMEFLAAADNMRDNNSVKFVLAGSNSLSGHHNDYAQKLEAARVWPNVLIHDQRIPFEDVERYFAASNIIALPYLEGTTSGVLKLALAFGRPVVATDVGDFPEQIPPGAGVLFPADQQLVANLIAAITTACAELPALTRKMQDSRGQAEWPDIAARLLTFLQAQD